MTLHIPLTCDMGGTPKIVVPLLSPVTVSAGGHAFEHIGEGGIAAAERAQGGIAAAERAQAAGTS